MTRFWKRMVTETLKKFLPSGVSISDLEDGDLQKIKTVFQRSGGSWVKLAEGSSDHFHLLKNACKAFLRTRKKREEVPYGSS